ncbi:unnamed protein product [Cunninghamella blakesleeana]
MSNISNKASEIVGGVKETIGNWTGNERLESEGNAQKNSSKVQGHVDNAKQQVNDTGDSVRNKVQGAFDGVNAHNDTRN